MFVESPRLDPSNVSHDLTLRIQVLKPGLAKAPYYATEFAAGLDLSAALEAQVVLRKGSYLSIPTGIAIELPRGYEGQVRPRSGLAAKHGITVLNAPGTIDADYRGEICVLLINHGSHDYTIQPGERIAQLLVTPFAHVRVEVVTELSSTARDAGGFGSTGQ